MGPNRTSFDVFYIIIFGFSHSEAKKKEADLMSLCVCVFRNQSNLKLSFRCNAVYVPGKNGIKSILPCAATTQI